MTTSIKGFFNEHRFMSNFWPSEVEYAGVTYATVEHAFQAAKFDDLDYREIIRQASTPGKSKTFGRTRDYPLRNGWSDGLAIQVMSELVAKKFTKHEELKRKLLDTGDAVLVETNSWGDDIWGDSTSTIEPGKNQLGIILMTVRSALRAANQE